MNGVKKIIVSILFVLNILLFFTGCGSGSGGDGGDVESENTDQSITESNMARFYFDCDLQGLTGRMVMDIEIVAATGVTWGFGPNPDITGVIGTGDYTIYTDGELNSSTSSYIFSGENQFADFTEINTFERFRVQWVEESDGITMIVNPFGQMPTEHFCILTNSELR